jgi:hypothetical protein
MKIQFSNVGRFKKSWEAELRTFDYDGLYKQVRTNGELMSRDVEFDFDDESGEGVVYAGASLVGAFKVVPEASPAPEN